MAALKVLIRHNQVTGTDVISLLTSSFSLILCRLRLAFFMPGGERKSDHRHGANRMMLATTVRGSLFKQENSVGIAPYAYLVRNSPLLPAIAVMTTHWIHSHHRLPPPPFRDLRPVKWNVRKPNCATYFIRMIFKKFPCAIAQPCTSVSKSTLVIRKKKRNHSFNNLGYDK